MVVATRTRPVPDDCAPGETPGGGVALNPNQQRTRTCAGGACAPPRLPRRFNELADFFGKYEMIWRRRHALLP